MATYKIKRVAGSGTAGEALVKWIGSFDDEYKAKEEAVRLAAGETDPLVEYGVWRVFPKDPPTHLGSYFKPK